MGDLSDVTGTEDYAGIQPDTGFEPLVPGWYPVEIERAEIKETNRRDGKYLKMQMSVVGENYNNRKLFANINIQNPNAKCVEIGLAQMAALKVGVGLLRLTDSSELLGKTLEVKVAVEKETNSKGEYDNKVTGYRAFGDAPVQQPQQQAQTQQQTAPAQQQQAPTGATKRPWER